MTTLLVLALLHLPIPGKAIVLPVKESAWVYPRATDPTGDEFLRIWGANGLGAPEANEDVGDFGFGFLRIDVARVPSGKPKKAVLVLHNIAPASFSEDDAKATPLQARALSGVFSAATWSYDRLATVHPGLKATVYGVGALSGAPDSDKPTEIDIDLMIGPNDFGAALAKAEAAADHALCLALTSAMEPNSGGGSNSAIYKIYSAAATEKALRPTLRLEY